MKTKKLNDFGTKTVDALKQYREYLVNNRQIFVIGFSLIAIINFIQRDGASAFVGLYAAGCFLLTLPVKKLVPAKPKTADIYYVGYITAESLATDRVTLESGIYLESQLKQAQEKADELTNNTGRKHYILKAVATFSKV